MPFEAISDFERYGFIQSHTSGVELTQYHRILGLFNQRDECGKIVIFVPVVVEMIDINIGNYGHVRGIFQEVSLIFACLDSKPVAPSINPNICSSELGKFCSDNS